MLRRPLFDDRRAAGAALGDRLGDLAGEDAIVVALPRGGVPVGYEVARALGAPLDIALVRKLGAPDQPELGIGALGEDGTVILDGDTVAALSVSRGQIDSIAAAERVELDRRRRLYRGETPPLPVRGRTAILVDDGVATGVTAVVAARVLRNRGASRVELAVPVCPAGTQDRLGEHFDRIRCLAQPSPFGGVGAWYGDFTQTPDREVVELLARRRAEEPARSTARAGRAVGQTIATEDGATLPAVLRVPDDARGLVIFVHGSGSSRLSPRNVAVARSLERRGLATLLFDLLTDEEAADRRNVFDIGLLTRRLVEATRWVCAQPVAERLPIGYFGASTGAAAALSAAAELRDEVAAVVSRGGRPDLAGDALADVASPTLLIVGGDDWNVLELNAEAAAALSAEHELAVIPGAGHLFEEPGALEEVARLAGDWLDAHLSPARVGSGERL
ncbi:MAG: phosphoribosyltransferase family protein [Thermoleophilaceae bacterium]